MLFCILFQLEKCTQEWSSTVSSNAVMLPVFLARALPSLHFTCGMYTVCNDPNTVCGFTQGRT
jgi:hypothetical protein